MRALTSYTEEGRNAYCDGLELADCPYEDETVRYFEWRAGWLRSMGDDHFSLDEPRDPLDYSHPMEVAKIDAWYAEGHAKFRYKKAEQLLPDLSTVAGVLGAPENWAGNCYATALKLKESGLLAPLEAEFGEIKLCYGVYDGVIASGSMFDKAPFSRHGWLEFEEGVVIDPTWWVFVGEEPSLRVANVEDYDLGASRLRQRVRNDTDPPAFDASQGVVRWTINDPDVTAFAELLLGDGSRLKEGEISRAQAFWLANRPLFALGNRASELYRALKTVGLGALIPIDNRAYSGVEYDDTIPTAKFK
jgi:hypothetical protein